MAVNRARRRWRLSGTLLLSLSAGLVGLLVVQSPAIAAPDLSSVVVSETFPGMFPASPGPQNGPVNDANIQSLNESPAENSALLGQINKGDVAGYVRLWSREPPNGDGVIITALRFQSSAAANEQLLEQDASLKRNPGSSPFSVPSIDLAVGYTVPTSTSTGISVSAHVVLFAEGNNFFQVGVLSESGDLTNANAIALANTQFSRVTASGTGSSSSTRSTAYRAGEIFGVVVLVLLAIWVISALMRRNRKGHPVKAPQRSDGATPVISVYPPSPPSGAAPGWFPSRANMNVQFFWNGTEWAGRKQWQGAGVGWVEEQPVAAH